MQTAGTLACAERTPRDRWPGRDTCPSPANREDRLVQPEDTTNMGALERIDETDARILDLLQRDGRESFADIGQAVGMSGPSAHERVKKLEARGIIRGYVAVADPTLLGYGVLAFIFIKQVPAGYIPQVRKQRTHAGLGLR